MSFVQIEAPILKSRANIYIGHGTNPRFGTGVNGKIAQYWLEHRLETPGVHRSIRCLATLDIFCTFAVQIKFFDKIAQK